MSDICPYVNAFRHVHKDWIQIMKPYRPLLHKIFKHIEGDIITPPLEDVFNAFILKPSQVKVVIIGQDPYPKDGDACGLSFSTRAKETPKSLANIYKCLNRLGYKTESNDLTYWALQGVLLLNTSLTTIVGASNSHAHIWKEFTEHIIKDLCRVGMKKGITFLLWGRHAQSLAPLISSPHIIKTWAHPSPLSGQDFTICDNFDSLKGVIDWSVPKTIDIYTDGACILGKKSSYAVYIPGLLKVYGLVDNNKYGLLEGDILVDTDSYVDNTSQRGEYLAMCYALWLVHRLKINARIITDSANTKGLLTEWDKKTEKYKNPDLVHIMRPLYNYKNHSGGSPPEIVHTQSHGRGEEAFKQGNDIVDKLARRAVETLKDTDTSIYIKYMAIDYGLSM